MSLPSSLGIEISGGYRQFPVGALMEIHGYSSLKSMSKNWDLEITEGEEPHLQSGTYRLTAVGNIQLPEQIVEMGLDRWRSDTELLREPFRRDALGDAPQDLHLPGCQRHRTRVLG